MTDYDLLINILFPVKPLCERHLNEFYRFAFNELNNKSTEQINEWYTSRTKIEKILSYIPLTKNHARKKAAEVCLEAKLEAKLTK